MEQEGNAQAAPIQYRDSVQPSGMLLEAGNPANYVSNVQDSREHELRQSLFYSTTNCLYHSYLAVPT